MRQRGIALSVICLAWKLVAVLNLAATGSLSFSQSSTCGTPFSPITTSNVTRRVVGGKPATSTSFPWTTVLMDSTTNLLVCEAAILSESVLLTAAHCFLHGRSQPRALYALMGVDALDEFGPNEQIHLLKSIVVHEHFNAVTSDNDIAVVKLTNNITFNKNVGSICFPDNNHTLPVGTECFLAGFGETLGTGTDGRLSYIRVPVIDDAVCSRRDWLWADGFQPNVSFCAGYADGGQDACTGDSGGALVAKHYDGKFYVYGISSWGSGCGDAKSPGVYTKVLKYVDWVKTTVAKF